MTCAVCGAAAARVKLRKSGVPIYECPACGLAFWQPDESFRPEGVYDAAYFRGASAAHGYDDYRGLEACLRATFAERLARIPRPDPGARLLDVGAAFGYAVAEATRSGWSATGLEVSPAATRVSGKTAPGAMVCAGAAKLPFADASFAVVTLWDVLEHLPDPHAAVREVARVLAPGGRLVLSTGDVGSWMARLSGSRWHLYTLPEHLFFYTRASLIELLERHGLKVESLTAESAIYTLGYLVERLRKTLLGRSGRGSRWPGAKFQFSVNLYDVVTVSAVRSDGG